MAPDPFQILEEQSDLGPHCLQKLVIYLQFDSTESQGLA